VDFTDPPRRVREVVALESLVHGLGCPPAASLLLRGRSLLLPRGELKLALVRVHDLLPLLLPDEGDVVTASLRGRGRPLEFFLEGQVRTSFAFTDCALMLPPWFWTARARLARTWLEVKSISLDSVFQRQYPAIRPAWIGAQSLLRVLGPRGREGPGFTLALGRAHLPWIKIDDHFDEHRKFLIAGPIATCLWLRCLAYCNRNLTDGFIPAAVAQEKAWSADPNAPGYQIERLVEAGLWEKASSGYVMHDYLDYQPSREDVWNERALKQAYGQAGGRASAKARAKASAKAAASKPGDVEVVESPSVVAGAQADAQADAQAESKPVPVPNPVSVPVKESKKRDTVHASRALFVKPTLVEVEVYCQERNNSVDPSAWMDHYESNGWKVGRNPMKSWKAAVRTWEKHVFGDGAPPQSSPQRAPRGPDDALMKARRQREEWEREQGELGLGAEEPSGEE